MKKLLIALITVIAITGCKPKVEENAPQKPEIVEFQIRDFKYEKEKVSAQGTLVTTNENLRKGTYVVWIHSKNKNNDEEQTNQFIIQDGIGKVDIVTIEIENISDLTIKVLGYIELKPGNLTVQ